MRSKHMEFTSKGLAVISMLSLCLGFSSEKTYGAEKDFPQREITAVVGFGAGGGRDILVRGVTKVMTKYLGVPMVVMNMPGAAGARGATHIYKSPPDGYTIGAAAATEVIGQIIDKQDYDFKKSTHIGRAQSSPSILFVKSDSPFRSMKDFKTLGGTVREATFSPTAPSTVGSMIVANREGFPLSVIGGYQTIPDTILSLIRGEVEFIGSHMAPALSFVRSGQIRPILVIGPKRLPEFPDVVTVGDMGYEDLIVFTLDFWFAGPPGIPRDRVKILEEALLKTLNDPEFLKWAEAASIDPGPLGSDEMTKMVFNLFNILVQYKEDIEKYVKK